MRVIVRGYKKRVLQFEEPLDVDPEKMDDVIHAMALRHVEAMKAGTLGVIEFEFVDEPDPNERFFRIGVETDGMVAPMELRPGTGLKGD
jgi:hypothetical protein